MSTVFVVHGTAGHPFENWFPWLYNELTNMRASCFVPQFPTLIKQTYKCWSNVLDGYVDSLLVDENTIFVTHSLGSIFIVRYLIQRRLHVKGLISVAGFNQYGGGNVEWDELNKDFFLPDSELKSIIKFTKFRYCFMSNNDPYLPLVQLEKFADLTNSQIKLVEGAGHFNSSAGYAAFHELSALLKKM